jgi:hypothetical protein
MLRDTCDERFASILRHFDQRNMSQILFCCTRPSLERFFDFKNNTFRQDSDPTLIVHIIMINFVNQHIDVLSWPAQNPDFNSIENL